MNFVYDMAPNIRTSKLREREKYLTIVLYIFKEYSGKIFL